MAHATDRDWEWIRKHSKMATGMYDTGVSIEDIKWWLDGGGTLRLARCNHGWEDDPTTQTCWTADAANIMVKRKSSGRLLVTSFWVED